MKTDLRSQSLDLLRFPLAIIIVLVHVFNKESIIVGDKIYEIYNVSLYNDFLLFVDGFLRGISVPVYFFISGYVFFLGVNDFTKEVYIKKLRNRIYTLLIPFVIWNIPDILIGLIKYIFNTVGMGFQTFGVELNLTLTNILSCFWQYNGELFVPITPQGERIVESSIFPINVPLWFMRDLMVVVIFTPLINFVTEHTKYLFFVVLAVLSLIPNIQIPYLEAFLFFSMGSYFSIYKKDMVTEFGRYFKVSMIIYPLFSLLVIMAIKDNNIILSKIFKQISVFGFLIFAYNISIWILKNTNIKPSKILSSASFFIYITHVLIFARITKILFILIKPDNGIATISVYGLSTAFTVLSLLMVYIIMRKYFFGILQFVTGRK